MMLTLQTVEAIIEYYARTRAAGHTTAMIAGAKNTEGAIVITHDASFARELNRTLPKAKVIPATGDIDISLRGRHSPLLIDHYVMTGLFSMLLSHINNMGRHISDLDRGTLNLNILIDHKNDILEQEYKNKVALHNALKELVHLIEIYEILDDFDEDDTDLADAVEVAKDAIAKGR